MKFLNLIRYCFECLMGCISATGGHVPENFSGKDIAVGIITLIIIMIIFFFIFWLIGVLNKKK